MDLLYFLKTRLEFIEQLYDSAVAPFEEIKRKIEEGEPPYVDERNPEYVSEPAFLQEAQQADDSVMVIGHWCLCMVQASLKAYLKEFTSPRGSIWWKPRALLARLTKKQGRNWFGRYRLLFLDDLGIDWNEGPVSLSELEQLNLTRDDLIHNMDIFSVAVERNEQHVERFPTGLFIDELWSGLGMERVKIDRGRLKIAIRSVREFCTWLEGLRCNYPKYVRGRTTGV